MIKPFKNINNIPVIFASDENYAPYLGITLKSATDKFSDDYNYDIIILENNIGDENKKRILKILLKYSVPLIPNALSWWIFSASDRLIVTTFLLSYICYLSVILFLDR